MYNTFQKKTPEKTPFLQQIFRLNLLGPYTLQIDTFEITETPFFTTKLNITPQVYLQIDNYYLLNTQINPNS